jgi:opacity protein-like surface antigen
MNRLIQSLAIGAMLAFALTSAASAADTPDPVIGTWKLNLEKSKFAAGNAPKSMTRTYAAAAGGTSMTVTGVAADGSTVSQSATLTYDGKDDAYTGSAAFDAVSLKKVNATTVKAEVKKDGKVVGHTTRTITGKGKVLTLSSAVKTANGGTTHEVAVYDKQ